MEHIKGIITPILTPFQLNGEIAEARLPDFLKFLAPHVNGFFVGGSFGSGMMMEIPQRKKMLKLVAAQNTALQKLVIAHVGTTSTASTIDLAQHAQQHGAHALAAILPYYYPHTDAAIIFHFKALIDNTDLPVYLYDYPSYVHREVNLDLFEKLIELGICGVKDTSGKLDAMQERIPQIPLTQCDYLVGTEAILVPAYELGVRGCISGLSNIFPELVNALFHALESNRQEEILHIQTIIFFIRQLMRQYSKMEASYAILKMRGVDGGLPRAPFSAMPENNLAHIKQELTAKQII